MKVTAYKYSMFYGGIKQLCKNLKRFESLMILFLKI